MNLILNQPPLAINAFLAVAITTAAVDPRLPTHKEKSGLIEPSTYRVGCRYLPIIVIVTKIMVQYGICFIVNTEVGFKWSHLVTV